ncbi:hypothetical protein ACFQGW_14465 [Xanthomonas theicola]|uniref:hypothetical protein n=1 Tax=Xanthomonas theicola TaxID=56464 RepID=UPI00360E4BA7
MTWAIPPGWRAGAGALSAQWLSILFAAAVSLGLSVWLARGMQPAGFGRYAYLLSVATLLALAQDAGLRTLVLRERVAPSPGLAAFDAALPGLARGHLLLVTLLLVGASGALAPFYGDPALPWAVLCFAAVTLSQLVSAQLKGRANGGARRAGRPARARSVRCRSSPRCCCWARRRAWCSAPGGWACCWPTRCCARTCATGRSGGRRRRSIAPRPASCGSIWRPACTGAATS